MMNERSSRVFSRLLRLQKRFFDSVVGMIFIVFNSFSKFFETFSIFFRKVVDNSIGVCYYD